jgi:hypothetical protein
MPDSEFWKKVVADRDGVLPPDDLRGPKFWRVEASGTLWPVVMDYLNGKQLSPVQVLIIRTGGCTSSPWRAEE